MALPEDIRDLAALIRGPSPAPVWSWRGQRLDTYDIVASIALAEKHVHGEKWDEADHPRVPAGDADGGQFAESGSGSGEALTERITINLAHGWATGVDNEDADDEPAPRARAPKRSVAEGTADDMLASLDATDLRGYGLGWSVKRGAAVATMHPLEPAWLPKGWPEGKAMKLDALNTSDRSKPIDTMRLMRTLTEAADAHGVTLTLNAQPFNTQFMRAEEIKLSDLKRFYRRYGFSQPRKGSPTFVDYDTMVRPPRTAAEKALDDALALLRGEKFNENHEPAGSPEGGQFAEADGGSGVQRVPTAAARTPKAVERKQGLYEGLLERDRVANVPANRRTVTAEQRAEIEDFVNQHGEDDVEFGKVWKSDGTFVESQGTEKGVKWEKGALANASVGAHNHPSGGGPSLQDVLTTASYRIPETVVVSAEYVYRFAPPKGGWTAVSRAKIIDAFAAARKVAEPLRTGRTGQPLTVRQIAAQPAQYTLGPGVDHQEHRDAFAEWSHALWGEFSRTTGIQYERVKR